MTITRLVIPDVAVLEPRVFSDDRGHFFESFSERTFAAEVGTPGHFVQDNQSLSRKGVLRGLHYQLDPDAQGKLVRAVTGSIFDVAVDIRRSSPTFGRWVGAVLSAENQRQIWVPEGFAHGFLALEDNTTVLYKTTRFYAPESERSIAWNSAGIEWPEVGPLTLAPKDAAAPDLANAECFP